MQKLLIYDEATHSRGYSKCMRLPIAGATHIVHEATLCRGYSFERPSVRVLGSSSRIQQASHLQSFSKHLLLHANLRVYRTQGKSLPNFLSHITAQR